MSSQLLLQVNNEKAMANNKNISYNLIISIFSQEIIFLIAEIIKY